MNRTFAAFAVFVAVGCSGPSALSPPGWCDVSFEENELVLLWCEPAPWALNVDRSCMGSVGAWQYLDDLQILLLDTACEGSERRESLEADWQFLERRVFGDQLGVVVPIEHIAPGETFLVHYMLHGDGYMSTAFTRPAQHALAADAAPQRR